LSDRPIRRSPRTVLSVIALAVALGLVAAPHALAVVRAAPVLATSSANLRFGMSNAARATRVPITAAIGAAPIVVYSVRLDPRRTFSRVSVRGMLQTAYCRSSDISGVNKPDQPCVGSQPYKLEPNIYARLVAATSPTATTGRQIAAWKGMPCGKVVHHCPLSIQASRAAVTGAGRYINLVASAQANGAAANQVLAVEPDQGEMQVIQILGATSASRPLVSGPKLQSFALSAGSSEATKSSDHPAVVFSRAVTVRAGDVLDVRTRFDLTIHNSADNAPFTGTSVFLTRRPTATFADRRLSFVGRAGQNCQTTCSVAQVGAIRSPLSGRVYVNVVIVVKDHEGSTTATASYAGNLSVVRRGSLTPVSG
jgi:hypothetical protein